MMVPRSRGETGVRSFQCGVSSQTCLNLPLRTRSRYLHRGMPPQPGVFNMRCAHHINPGILYSSSHHSAGPSRVQSTFLPPPPTDDGPHYPCCLANTDSTFDCFSQTDNAGDDPKRERKRKELAGRLSREMNEHRDECVFSFLLPVVRPPPVSERSG